MKVILDRPTSLGVDGRNARGNTYYTRWHDGGLLIVYPTRFFIRLA